jgi:hypothetical protein
MINAFDAYMAWRETPEAARPIGKRGRMRPPAATVVGFCEWAGVTQPCFYNQHLRKGEGWQDAIDYCKTRIQAYLQDAGLHRDLDSNLVARIAGLADKVDQRTQDTTPAPPEPRIPPELVADRIHPDCTYAEQARLEAAGLLVPLYSQQQLDAGQPYHPPSAARAVIEHE